MITDDNLYPHQRAGSDIDKPVNPSKKCILIYNVRMDMTDSTPVTRALDALGIPFVFFRHTGQVASVEQAAAERGMTIDQVVRSIVFRTGPGLFLMVLVGGTRQVSWPALRRALGQSRLTMASEEEVLQVTGYRLGAVSPFGLPAPMRILVDRSAVAPEVISLGTGIRYTAVVLKSVDLLKALGDVEPVDLSGE